MVSPITINGIGRIGRMVFRRAISEGLNIIAINASIQQTH